MRKKIKYLIHMLSSSSSLVALLDAANEHGPVEHWSQSTVLILNSMIMNPKIGHVTRSNVLEPIQNVSKAMKEYQQLNR
jgi:hypothetical protein